MMHCRVESLRIGPEKNFCYLVFCPETGVAALVDGAYEFDKITRWIDSFRQPSGADHEGRLALPKMQLKYLLTTHGHADHAGGLNEMKKRFVDAKIAAHQAEKNRLARSGIMLDLALVDGDELVLGHQKIKVWHSPGHTEGGCCYLTRDQVITGDTLFVGQCGRTDLEGGSDALLFHSLQRLKTLPPHTIVRPGHDYGATPQSTIADEMKNNPTMKVQNLAEFTALP